jgi:hypothetical protein
MNLPRVAAICLVGPEYYGDGPPCKEGRRYGPFLKQSGLDVPQGLVQD